MQHAKGHANVVLWTIKVVLQKFKFISMSCDEVAIVNNQSWLFMNVCDKKMEKAPHFVELAIGGEWSQFGQLDCHDCAKPCEIWRIE
jgi:hypothetical protein